MTRRSVLAACTIVCGLAAALVLPGLARADLGIQGPAYVGGTSGVPTTSKPESKLWFNDGFWWAVMAKNDGAGQGNNYHIFRLRLGPQKWADTGVVVDTRDSTRQDVLSTGSKLIVASHKYVDVARNDSTPMPSDEMRLSRFSYNASTNTYSLDGVTTIDAQKSETLVIDRENSTGAVWATWVQESAPNVHQVYAKKTNGDCVGGAFALCTFGGPTVTLDASVSADDISSVIGFGGNKIGVMWSDSGVLRFAVHNDADAVGTWSAPENVTDPGMPKLADDHINLKADSSGRVYAVTKTKFIGASKPGTVLHRRSVTGTWSAHTVSIASLDRTRPIVVLDQQHNAIRVFEASTQNTAIFMKRSKLATISFPAASAGARVIEDVGSHMGNPTSTKQTISNATRLIVLAGNPTTKRYWHAYFQVIPCINGNGGNNVLVGTRGNDVLCGKGGADTLKGLGGNDRLVGGAGGDNLIGGGGADSLSGGTGRDTFSTRDGVRDVLSGGGGRDRAHVDAKDVRRSIEALF